MAPFSGDGVGSDQWFAVYNAAASGTQNYAEDNICVHCRAVERFGQGETVCVIQHADGTSQFGGNIFIQTKSVKRRIGGVFDLSVCG